jgi:hypothetical protein
MDRDEILNVYHQLGRTIESDVRLAELERRLAKFPTWWGDQKVSEALEARLKRGVRRKGKIFVRRGERPDGRDPGDPAR